MSAQLTAARAIKRVYMTKKLSVDEIKAVAEAAITAKHTLDAAKNALDAAPDDANLKKAHDDAKVAYDDAKASADALSQNQQYSPEQIAKMKRKRAAIDRDLREAGELDSDENDDDPTDDDDLDDDDEDLDKPVTRRDLRRIERSNAAKTALQMADAVTDEVAKKAVKDALKRIRPSGNSEQDFADAVALANRERNSKILEELGRKSRANVSRGGSGAPPRPEEDAFEPTNEEARFMRPPFNMTKEEILKARPAQE